MKGEFEVDDFDEQEFVNTTKNVAKTEKLQMIDDAKKLLKDSADLVSYYLLEKHKWNQADFTNSIKKCKSN